MKGNITKSELKIMNVLWEHGTQPLTGIIYYLNSEWKNQTILTLISRLEEKEYIGHRRVSRQYFYTALREKEECLREGCAEFLEDWRLDVKELLLAVESVQVKEVIPEEEISLPSDWDLSEGRGCLLVTYDAKSKEENKEE